MKDFDPYNFTWAAPVSEYRIDPMLPAGITESNNAFEIPNSEGKEMKKENWGKKPKSIAIYCSACSHHWYSTKVPDDWWKARVEKCANCLGTGGRCTKCDEENKVRQPKSEAA